MGPLLNSLLLSLGVAGCATVLGAPLGYLLARGQGRVQALLLFMLLVPLAVPPYVLAMAWINLLGRNGWLGQMLGQVFEGPANLGLYSLPGAILVMALGSYPIPLIAAFAGTRGLDPRVEEAARLAGGRAATLRRVTIPLLLPPVSGGAMLVFLLTLLAFSVPSLLQTPVYSFEVFSRFSTGASLGEALRYATLLVAVGILLGGLWLGWLHRQLATQSSDRADGPYRYLYRVYLFFVLVCVGLFSVFPIVNLTLKAAPVSNIAEAWSTAWEELGTSVVLAGCSATVGLSVGLLLAFGSLRRLGFLCWASALPYLVSGPVLGIALIYIFNAPGWRGAVYDSFGIMVIACVLRYTIFAHAGLYVALQLRTRLPEEAAATLGAGRWSRLFRITLPGIGSWLVGLWFLLFVLCFGEVDAVLLVVPPGWTPLSVRLYSLMHYGPSGLVYALSLLTTAVTLVVAGTGFLCWKILRRKANGT